MKNNTTFSLFITTFLIHSICFAQDRDQVTVNYSFSKIKYNDTSANAKQLEVKFRVPLYQKNKNTFIAAIGYKNVSLNHFPESYKQTLHGITLQTIWLHRFSSKKSLTIFTQAGLFTDMEDINARDLRYTIGFRYRYKHSGKLTTGWGLAYSRQFFGNQIVPFIDVDYKPNNKWSITGQFPIKPKVVYHINQKLSTGIEINGEAASYRLSAVEKKNRFIQVNQWAGIALLEYQFAKSWHFNLGIGRNFRQSFKLYDNASTTPWTIITIPIGNKSEPVHRIDSKGPNIQLGISFNPFK